MFSPQLNSKFITCFTVILLCFTASVCEAQRLHPKVKNKAHQIQKIVVLPATVSFGRIGMKGVQTKQSEAVNIEPQIERAVAKEFSNKKMTVLPSPFTEEELAKNKDLNLALAQVQGDFDQLLRVMSRKAKDVEKGRFSLSDKVILLNQDDQVDAFVFIRAVGLETSKGKKAFSILMAPINPATLVGLVSISQVWVTMVDARSGEVLAHRSVVMLSNLKKGNESDFDKMFAGSFKKLADANTTPSVKK